MSTEKPSKDDLLDELQSIRDFLTDHPLHDGDDQDIPTLTSVASEKLGIEVKKQRKKTRNQNLQDHLSGSDPIDEHLVPILTMEEEDVPILQPEPFDAVAEAPVSDDAYIIDDSELHVPEQLRGGLFGGKDDEFVVEDPYATDDVYSPTPPPISEHSIVKDNPPEDVPAHYGEQDNANQSPSAPTATQATARAASITSTQTDTNKHTLPSAATPHQPSSNSTPAGADEHILPSEQPADQQHQTLADTSISRAISDADLAHHKAQQERTSSNIPPAQSEHSHYTLAKGSGENPFLPKHIRERLGKHQDIIDEFKNFSAAEASKTRTTGDIASDITSDITSDKASIASTKHGTENDTSKQHNAGLGTFENPTAHIPEPRSLSDTLTHQLSNTLNASHPPSSQINSIIEEVLAEFMPKIEKRLREKLKSDVSAWNDEQ